MDTTDVVSIVLRGAMGRRGRKRARRAINFLTGHRGFLTASTLLGAAGVAWGIYDSMKSGAPAAPAAASATGAPPPVPAPSSGGAATVVLPNDLLRIVRLAVSAARADGMISPEERAAIVEHAQHAGLGDAIEQELGATRPLAEIVGGVTDAQHRQDLYVFAFAIVRADEGVSGAERVYLAQLAHQLQLDVATVARLEQDAAARIDRTPEAQP